ncbi:3-isopropylmalate dehydrogenase [Portibacter lacus]|uniref:3-isopropylmalate dehydrogenase n=1 Tax=Portibacter lacus TaxID=1099794 RepID=A0AA37WDN8_9BACT|nr:3-isopropylmalate dehydrogenase [Portibacter lacus]GLR18116.1 3-isopropylmalate dehydrogenase [Portibacter lacus]
MPVKQLKNITILPGDGIGPEVIAQAEKSIQAIAYRYNHDFSLDYAFIGAHAIEETGSPFPEETLRKCRKADAILLGAIGDPKYDEKFESDLRPEQGLLALRKQLQLYANIRPIKVYDNLTHLSPLKEKRIKNVNFVIYRELTGGIYYGKKGRYENGKIAYDHCVYSESEIKRIAILAFEAAMDRRKKLCLVDKANVLETSRLWRSVVKEVAKKYPDVETSFLYIDNAAMQMMNSPAQFDIILTTNLFGDILSDEASIIPGSLGLLPSASIGRNSCLFEPVHGSFPQAAGKDIANPMGAILSVAMMFRHFEMEQEALEVERAVDLCMKEGIMTKDLEVEVHYSCSQLGDLIYSIIAEDLEQINKKQLSVGSSSII